MFRPSRLADVSESKPVCEDVDSRNNQTTWRPIQASSHSTSSELDTSPVNPSLQPDPSSRTSDLVHGSSLLDTEEQPTAAASAAVTAASTPSATRSLHQSPATAKEAPVTWKSLPQKDQLAILTIARLSEPLAERSLAAYLFYQLRSFDPTLPDSTITWQGGLLVAAFPAAQFLTAVWWGRAADTPWIGRKRVLLVGLFGAAVASIGVGFSTTFAQALCFRTMAGALNGNTGVMRTMISEVIQEKKYQSRAFLLLPMCFNIGVVIGPIMGGFLADPIASFPQVFGPGSALGGKDGVGWMKQFPYGLPNLFSGVFIMISALAVILGLNETHEALRNKPDYGRKCGRWLAQLMCGGRNDTYSYTQLSNDDETELEATSTATHSRSPSDVENASAQQALVNKSEPDTSTKTKPRPTLRRILVRNVVLTLISHYLLALHVSTFNALIFLFLPNPRAPQPKHFSLFFTGGLGLSSSNVGLTTAIIGLVGFPLQIFVYPPLNARLGTLRGYRLFLPFSALAYTCLPFLVTVPEKAWLIWPMLTLVLVAQVLSRTFALTGTVILINNSAPSPDMLGTIHGVAQSVSSAARMVGPTLGGWALGQGIEKGCVGAVWWAMASLVGANWGLLWCIHEGDGHGGRA